MTNYEKLIPMKIRTATLKSIEGAIASVANNPELEACSDSEIALFMCLYLKMLSENWQDQIEAMVMQVRQKK